ncbi:MAG: aminopeptidase [Asgard group archaeon]|nr:aminopeptidase [Asgard group archaeon]
MYGDFESKLAKLVVNYSLNIQPKDLVVINGNANAEKLIRELYRETVKTGAYIFRIAIKIPGLAEIFFKYANNDQLSYFDSLDLDIARKVTKSIHIFSAFNTRSLANVPPEKLAMFSKAAKEARQIYSERTAKGEHEWVICPNPTLALAQEANMGIGEYTEFVYKALALDKEDPVEHWLKIKDEQEKIVKILDKGKVLRIVGEDTDLTLGIEGRKWINCCGDKNLPDGEVFTSPIEDAVNGTIRFTYPGIYSGQEVENIWLKFKDGQVVDFEAVKGKELLTKLLELENAKILGEVAIGTNYGIQRFTKNMLFDEKMGGTVHLALGNGMPEAGSKNISPIHWDILKDMKSKDSKIYLDGEIIYEAGEWKIGK